MTMRHAVLVAICLLAPVAVAAQGVRLVTDAALADAAAAAKTPDARAVYSPLLIALSTASPSGDEGLQIIAAHKRAPFRFYLHTPFSRAVGAYQEAARKFQPTPTLTPDELNAGLVVVSVEPSDDLSRADSIENVVVKRGSDIIRPAKSDVTPATFKNRLGAEFRFNTGRFTFPIETFDPAVPTTIVMVGTGGNFEWTVQPHVLNQLR